MTRKYEFTGEEKQILGRTLKRIRRISDGLVGGWIEKENNLSQDGTCFVYDNARVYDNASVSDNASVYDNARVFGYACVYDNARVFGYARVSSDARVFGNMVCTEAVMCANLYRYTVTCSDSHISVGCEVHTFEVWKEHGERIAKEDGFSDEEIELYKSIVHGMMAYRKATSQKPERVKP